MQSGALEMPGTIDDAVSEVARIKTMVTDAVEEGVKSAMKAIKQGRYAAEDMIGDARYTVKRRPFQALGLVFGAGVLIGGFVAWLASRRD
jgi:ElaB/YqjD/DUF883 family membrane-anchored ribosome-binding protein